MLKGGEMKSEMLSWLQDYIKVTPKEELQKQWSEIENLGFKAPNAYEYLNYLTYAYTYTYDSSGCLLNNIKTPENMTPNFSESFFLVKLAV
jgi:hypothetical protein